ncbi:MAG: 30S ribosome-binding factor RbfA [Vampirovibrionales bacterium]
MERSSFSRVDRVRKQVMREFADILKTEIQDPRLDDFVISVVDVEMTPDLSSAKIYLSILADAEIQTEVMTLIMEYKGKIRKAIGSRIRLRQTPEIALFLDDTLERGTKVTYLLNQIARGEVE